MRLMRSDVFVAAISKRVSRLIVGEMGRTPTNNGMKTALRRLPVEGVDLLRAGVAQQERGIVDSQSQPKV